MSCHRIGKNVPVRGTSGFRPVRASWKNGFLSIARAMARLGLSTRLTQGMRQSQEMTLAPRMLQSIEVLSLALGDLEGWLETQAEGNEALLVEPAAAASEVLDLLEPTRSRAALAKAADDHHAMLQAQPDPGVSLADSLLRQLDARAVEGDVGVWARFLVGCLTDTGLLEAEDAELRELGIAADLPFAGVQRGDALLGEAICELQQLEPAGVGARSSVEALLLQLDPSDDDYGLLCTLLEDFLVELSRNQRPSVASKLGLELAELDRLLGVLERLETRPAAAHPTPDAPTVVPDVLALPAQNGTWTVELTRGALPAVSIDPIAEELLSSLERGDEARSYLAAKVEKARWVTEAVEMRGSTLLRVASEVLERQRGFLEEGPKALRALSMGEVAEVLGLATSTVSRAVAGKHVQTPYGIVALRTFFQSSVGEEGGGSAIDAVREKVRELVAAEDTSAPLSDEALVESLASAGHKVARRTVAKYRKELGIPSSYRRRRHA